MNKEKLMENLLRTMNVLFIHHCKTNNIAAINRTLRDTIEAIDFYKNNYEAVFYLIDNNDLNNLKIIASYDEKVFEKHISSFIIKSCSLHHFELTDFLLEYSQKHDISYNHILYQVCKNNDIKSAQYLLSHALCLDKYHIHDKYDTIFKNLIKNHCNYVINYLIDDYLLPYTKSIQSFLNKALKKDIDDNQREFLIQTQNSFLLRDLHYRLKKNLPYKEQGKNLNKNKL